MKPGMDLSAFSPEKRKLLEQLLAKKGVQRRAGGGSIPKRAADAEPARLSFLQEGLWFLDALDPGKATYNIPCATRMRGALDVPALERAFGEMLARHESLRTVFPERDGVPVQVVQPAEPFHLELEDLTGLAAAAREERALARATEEAHTPFDLEHGPIFRAALLKLGAQEHVLVFGLHHIVGDGWSMGVITREFTGLYEAFAAGRTSPLQPLPIQFSDFAAWQRDDLQGERLEQRLGFWRERLDGVADLQLPWDRPRSAKASEDGRHHTFTLTKDLSDRLRALSREAEVTAFVTLLAGFEACLHTYSGQSDMVIGSPVACRNKSELEGLIGYFVNVLPFRTELGGNPSFRELLDRVNVSVEEVHANQDVPFGKLVEELKPRRTPGANPVYQVELTLLTQEHAPAIYGYGFRSAVEESLEIAGLRFSPLRVESGVSKFDIVVLAWDVPAGICGTFEYNADLFDARTIELLSERFSAVLERLVDHPDTRLATLGESFPRHAPSTPAAKGPRGPSKRPGRAVRKRIKIQPQAAPPGDDSSTPTP